MTTREVLRIVGIAGVVSGVIGSAFIRTSAASATASLDVSASVTNNCTISAAALGFGSYDPVVANAAGNLDGTGVVTVACTKGATATIGLGVGNNASGSTRRLSDGSGNFLSYELYSNAGRTNIWNTTTGTLATGAAPSKASRDFTVYGRIGPNQDVPAGAYSDSVVATVNF
jgi:spore coat protein U-like protein